MKKYTVIQILVLLLFCLCFAACNRTGCNRAVDPNHLMQQPIPPMQQPTVIAPNTINQNLPAIPNPLGTNNINGTNYPNVIPNIYHTNNGLNNGGVDNSLVPNLYNSQLSNPNLLNQSPISPNLIHSVNPIQNNPINNPTTLLQNDIDTDTNANSLDNSLLSNPTIATYQNYFTVNFFGHFSLRHMRRGTRIDIMNITHRVFEQLQFVFVFVNNNGIIQLDYTTKLVKRIAPGQSTSFFVETLLGRNRVVLTNILGLVK